VTVASPKAADLLHVARNTVAYRVKKVESLIGRNLRDRRLELESAFATGTRLDQRLASRTWCSCSTLPFQGRSRGPILASAPYVEAGSQPPP
jgi:PucR C-terminal helix-turn-helix domain